MAFSVTKFLKGILIREENTLTPKEIDITPGGSASTKTSIVSSQTANRTLTLPDATDTLVGKATTDIFTNKSIDADTNTVTNIKNADIKAAAGIVYSKLNLTNSILNADINASAAIDASKIANGTVSNAEFQQLDGLTAPAVGTTQTQTLTNKTLVVANNTITTAASGNLAATELNAALVELQLDIDGRANRTLSNLTSPTAINQNLIAGTHNAFSLGDSNTKFTDGWFDSSVRAPQHFVVASGSGSSTATGSLNAVGTAPDGSSVGAAVTNSGTSRAGVVTNENTNADAVVTGDILIATGNKTAGTGNSGTIKIRPGTSSGGTRGKILLEDGSLSGSSTGYVWTLQNTSTGEGAWSASSGGGSSSLVTNGSADNASASIFVPYQDSSGSRPSDGTGGTTTGLTTSITSTTPLVGTKSFLLTKDAANRQGGGWSVPFTVDPAYRAKALKISMDYIVNTGTFVAGSSTSDSDVIMYIYDVTNSQLIEPSNIKFLSNSSSISDKIEATFQTSVSGSSYRLIFHCATTSASAYELKVDNVIVSPQTYVFGTPVTDWQSFTTTGTWTSNTSYTGKKRRVGDNYEYDIKVSLTGAPNATGLNINLPDTIDTSKITVTTSNYIGRGIAIVGGGGYEAIVSYATATSVAVFVDGSAGTYTNIPSLFTNVIPTTFVNGDFVNVKFSLPIVGLSSSVQMSDEADTRVVAAIISANGQTFSTGSSQKFTNLTAISDTHGALSSTRYTARASGYYQIDQSNGFNSASATFRAVEYYINGGSVQRVAGFNGTSSTATNMPASYKVYLNVGDYLEFGGFQNTGANETVSAIISISRISGPQAIAASEKIQFSVTHTSGQSIGAGVDVTAICNVKEYDSHNIYNTSTGAFSFPRPGVAKVKSRFLTQNIAAGTTPLYAQVTIYKNGVAHKLLSGRYNPGAGTTTYAYGEGSVSVYSLPTDVWTIRIFYSTATSVFIDPSQNYIMAEME